MHQTTAQDTEVIDHQLAIEVIVFVLNRNRQEALGLQLEGLTVLVERPDGDALSSVDVFAYTREREAAFVECGFAFGSDDLGIDEDAQVARLVLAGGHIHDEKALRNAELRGGQTDARGRVHRLGHVVDQAVKLRIKDLDVFTGLSEPLIGVEEYGANHQGTSKRPGAQER